MKIHYISCHAVLEYDEVKLFTELGYEVYSNGVYRDPRGAYTLPRPGIPGAPISEEFMRLTAEHPKTDLPPELIEPYDTIIIMHQPDIVIQNWPKIKHKRVIWRTIGQSTPGVEARMAPLKAEGLEIVRYSKMEANILNYCGQDALIYFYKDPEEFKDWNGKQKEVVNFTQSLLGRRDFTHYDEIVKIMEGFEGKVFGPGNDDLGPLNGGEIPYEKMKEKLRDCRVFLYGGTWPASYTLAFIEAMMTGIPVVALGPQIAETDKFEKIGFYEIPNIIQNGINGYLSDDITMLKDNVTALMNDPDLARKIGEEGRRTAIAYFGKEKIAQKWKEFLG